MNAYLLHTAVFSNLPHSSWSRSNVSLSLLVLDFFARRFPGLSPSTYTITHTVQGFALHSCFLSLTFRLPFMDLPLPLPIPVFLFLVSNITEPVKLTKHSSFSLSQSTIGPPRHSRIFLDPFASTITHGPSPLFAQPSKIKPAAFQPPPLISCYTPLSNVFIHSPASIVKYYASCLGMTFPIAFTYTLRAGRLISNIRPLLGTLVTSV